MYGYQYRGYIELLRYPLTPIPPVPPSLPVGISWYSCGPQPTDTVLL